jgi:hypothetical protein
MARYLAGGGRSQPIADGGRCSLASRLSWLAGRLSWLASRWSWLSCRVRQAGRLAGIWVRRPGVAHLRA